MKTKVVLACFVLVLCAAVASAQSPQGPDELFQFIADRIDKLVQDLVGGKITPAQAALEISDLQFMAAAGQFAFSAEIKAAGNVTADALTGLQGLLGSASEALAANGNGDLQEAFLVRLGTASQVTSAIAAVLRGGAGNLTVQQLAALQSATPGAAVSVRAADYRTPLAQGSIATLFSNRAVSTSRATGMFDAAGQLPKTLAGVTVTVGGRLVPLFYAGPNQVNFLIPSSVAAGAADVVVTGNNGAIASGTMQVVAVAPAIFTENASGSGTGSILNAVTFRRGPFAVTTPEIPGEDKRTRLAIFATGIRNLPNTDTANDLALPGGGTLANVAESLRVTIGNILATVEYAGPHPVFQGLDQINILLPAQLAGRGTVDVVVQAGSLISNSVQVTIQ